MLKKIPQSAKPHGQSGFALLLVVFLTTLMLIAVMAAAPSIRTERRREKEEQMIWSGKQYIRGVKMYYRKMGRFPTSLDDLTKPKTGTLRFMRQQYKDPMNTEDGAWRLIYVGPAGQLIGSLKPQQTLRIPGLSSAPAGANTSQGSTFAGSPGASPFGQSGTPVGQQTVQTGFGASGQSSGAGVSADADLPASAISSANPIMGANIIGVGSKINKSSIIVYDNAKNYRLFEFIWNPSKDLMNALAQPGTTAGNPNASGPQSGFVQGPGVGGSTLQPAPQPTPPQPTPPQP